MKVLPIYNISKTIKNTVFNAFPALYATDKIAVSPNGKKLNLLYWISKMSLKMPLHVISIHEIYVHLVRDASACLLYIIYARIYTCQEYSISPKIILLSRTQSESYLKCTYKNETEHSQNYLNGICKICCLFTL